MYVDVFQLISSWFLGDSLNSINTRFPGAITKAIGSRNQTIGYTINLCKYPGNNYVCANSINRSLFTNLGLQVRIYRGFEQT